MVFFQKIFEDLLLSKNHCKVRSKPDVSLLSASKEKPPLHVLRLFFVVVSGGGLFQDRSILPEVHDFSDLSVGSLVKFDFAALGPFSCDRSHMMFS